MKNFFIDTDVLIDYLRDLKDVRNFLFKLRRKNQLSISVINVVEIYSGKAIKDPNKREIINQFLSEFEIIPLYEI